MRAYTTRQEGAPAEPNATNKTQAVATPGTSTLGLWGALAVLYIFWDFVVLGNKDLEDTIKPSNIRANLYNLVVIGIAAVLFVNIAKVLTVKVVAWRIPGLSWLAEEITPLLEL